MKCLIRAHQLCQEGYQVQFKDMLITVWSAPNYLYRFGKNTPSPQNDIWVPP